MATTTTVEEQVINEPYNPIYSPFRSKPVLVRQYVPATSEYLPNTNLLCYAGAQTIPTLFSLNDHGLALYCSITILPMHGITVRMRGVGLFNADDTEPLLTLLTSIPLMAPSSRIYGCRLCSDHDIVSPQASADRN
jgi:hypothetical protein